MRPEPDPAAVQAAFAAALAGGEVPPFLRAPDPSEVARRFAVYRNNVQFSLGRALAARFPVVEQLVGATFFAALARVFVAAHPPRDPVLMRWGAALPDFLAGFGPVAHLPWLADVARLEWARGAAVHAADAAPADPAALAAAPPEGLRLGLHPSVALFASAHPAVAIWLAHQPGAPAAPLPPGPSFALIGRQPDFTVILAPIDAPTHAVLTALAAGAALGAAATRGDPTPALALLLRHGLIATLDTGEAP